MNYWLHPGAREDLREAAEFHREQAGTTLSQSFLAEFEHSVGFLLQHPGPGAIWHHGKRRLVTRRFPFSVVYTVVGEEVRILAVAHHSRRPWILAWQEIGCCRPGAADRRRCAPRGRAVRGRESVVVTTAGEIPPRPRRTVIAGSGRSVSGRERKGTANSGRSRLAPIADVHATTLRYSGVTTDQCTRAAISDKVRHNAELGQQLVSRSFWSSNGGFIRRNWSPPAWASQQWFDLRSLAAQSIHMFAVRSPSAACRNA